MRQLATWVTGELTSLRRSMVHRRQAIVTAVTMGPPTTVTCKFHASDTATFTVRCLDSYGPVVGDVVWLLIDGPDMICLGTLTQHPWLTPTFLNGWINWFVGQQEAKYRKESGNIVRIDGNIKSGTIGQPAFVLPVGYRPMTTKYFAATGSASGRLLVRPNGEVVPELGDNTFYAIHATFLAEQ